MSKNKFGIAYTTTEESRRARAVGPMGAAVRETADHLAGTTEAKLEQRRQNAEDARELRAAREAGRVLQALPLDRVRTDALPRDRLDLEAAAASDEMEELKASIRARGQKEPIEVWTDGDVYQLKKGWRRLTALSQLLAETGEERFSTVVARVAGPEDRIERYIDMVEENVVREDLTFAEMAQVAITAAADPGTGGEDAEAMVGRLYASLHKMKRSYIRSFVHLLTEVGDVLRFPREVSRNLGVDVARALKAGQGDRERLREALGRVTDAEAQTNVMVAWLAEGSGPQPPKRPEKREKFQFHVGAMKVTARQGECRIVSATDFAAVPKERLELAVVAFEKALRRGE